MARARVSGSKKPPDHVAFHRGTVTHPPSSHAPTPHKAPPKHGQAIPAAHHAVDKSRGGAHVAAAHQRIEAARTAHKAAVVAHKTDIRSGMVSLVHNMALQAAAARASGTSQEGISTAPGPHPPAPTMDAAMRDAIGGAIGGDVGAMIASAGADVASGSEG